jgi:hypothetical protein
MRHSTILTTLLLALLGAAVTLFMFFPGEAALVTGSVRRMIDPKRPDLVRLEYIAVNPEQSRGWRTLRVLERGDQCLPLLDRNHSRDPALAGPIGALRCVSYRKDGEMIEVLETRRLAPQG